MLFVSSQVKVDKWDQLIDRYPVRVGQIVSKITHDAYANSQLTVPVRRPDVERKTKTRGGALKNSGQVHMTAGNMIGEITYTMYYAGYVHEGTIYVAPRPWLRDACERIVPIMQLAFSELERQLVS